jgi:hypothetical protein
MSSTEPSPDPIATQQTDDTSTTDSGTAPVTAGSLDELPDWAQTEIRRARTEASKYRRERNTAQKALQDKDTTTGDQESRNEVDRLAGELDTARLDAAKLRAALAAKVPPAYVADFASRLVGTTEDELAADAVRLRELLGLPDPDRKRPDPSQGAGLDDGTTASSPAEAFAAFVQDRLN